MRKQRKQEAGKTISLRLWTHTQAMKAVPYLRAVVRSLREHWLEWRRARLQAGRMDARPGRPDRRSLILREEIGRDADSAEEHFDEALTELTALDVYSIDPARGLAMIPFAQGNELAWFVFDLFAPEGVETWRFHADALEMRRALVERFDPALSPKLPAAEVDLLMSQAAQGN